MEESKSKKMLSKNDNKQLDLEKNSKEDSPTFWPDSTMVPMTISDDQLDYIDSDIVSKQFYNNFNFSKLSERFKDLNVAVGITSANKGEGKTLVASNMAVSLAQAYRQKTVLVDLNFQDPQLHKIFGARINPGMVEAMQTRMLRVRQTKIDDLYLLSAGKCSHYTPGIKDTLALREILYTLKSRFDFIIVDMSSVFPIEDFPIHFLNEVDGLLTVVDAQNTRQEHLQKIYKHIDENRFVGYIFNRFSDN